MIDSPVVTTEPVSRLRIARDQAAHATVALWRTRVVLIFTFAMPLVWLVLIGLLAGNDAVGEDGVRVMQFAAPTAIAMGTFFATMPSVAIATAEAREKGVLKRYRGTPLPGWAYIVGQVGAAIAFAVASLAITLVVSVAAYQVRLRAETVPAMIVTLLLGVMTFSALGLAIGSVCRTASLAEAVSIGSAVALSFISGIFLVGATLPTWLETIARALPLKPYADSLQDQFTPGLEGRGWNPAQLGIIAGWGVAGAVIGLLAFRWEGRGAAGTRSPRTPGSADPVVIPAAAPTPDTRRSAAPPAAEGRRPSTAALLARQSVASLRQTWRRPGDVFFTVLMPVGLFALLVTVEPRGTLPDGTSSVVSIAAGMVTWGAGVTVFMTLAEGVARARDTLLLKRVRGTPLPVATYLAGRTVAGFALVIVIQAAVLLLGATAYGMRLDPLGVLLGAVVLTLGVAALAACGFLLTTLVSSARAVGAVGLVLLFLLAFFSDVFLRSQPEWMNVVGSFFPLQHLQNGLAAAWADGGPQVPWLNLAVLTAWAVPAGILSIRRFRWAPT